MTGTAPGCRWVAVKISDVAQVAGTAQWLSGIRTPPAGRLDRPVDVSTHSFSSIPPPSPAQHEALQLGSDFGRAGRGLLLFFSAGNSDGPAIDHQLFAGSDRTILIGASTLIFEPSTSKTRKARVLQQLRQTGGGLRPATTGGPCKQRSSMFRPSSGSARRHQHRRRGPRGAEAAGRQHDRRAPPAWNASCHPAG